MIPEPTIGQLEIRDHLDPGLLVIAPAGCGKSEALALRVQGMLSRGMAPGSKRVLVLTFSNRAKDNIGDRLARYLTAKERRTKVTVLNFHGLSARLFRSHAAAALLDPTWALPDNDWVKEQCQRRGLSYAATAAVGKTLQSLKQQNLSIDELGERIEASGNTNAIEIEKFRVQECRLTYDDLPHVAEIILGNDGVADLYRAHFAAVIVDEFQDLTPQQLRIVDRIGEGRTTFAGDLAQGIYGFTGARPTEVHSKIRRQISTVIELDESHRSSPAVLRAINSLTNLTQGSALKCAAPETWPSGGVAARASHASAEDEAAWVVRFVKAVLSRVPHHRVGVISRIGSRRRFIDEAFVAENDLEVHRWEDGVLDTETARTVKAMLTVIDLEGVMSSEDPLESLRTASHFDEIQDPDDRSAVADAMSWVLELLGQGVTVREVARRIRVGDGSTLLELPGVHLLSGHAGKGQQFDWVVCVGLEDGNVPFFQAKSDEALLEEVRVLSVMMSRARHGLVLTHAAAVPALDGRTFAKSPSRFLTPNLQAAVLDREGLVDWFRAASWTELSSR